MIDTNETGTMKLSKLTTALEKYPDDFTPWESEFIDGLPMDYSSLSYKQKSTVGTMYDKIILGK